MHLIIKDDFLLDAIQFQKFKLEGSHESFQSEDSFSEGVNLSLKFSDVKVNFINILTGNSDCLPRTSNFLHVFGNITVSC